MMRALTLACETPNQQHLARRQLESGALGDPAWVLVYCVPGAARFVMNELARLHPGVPVFGATSFRGVFCPSGFETGPTLLVAEHEDEVQLSVSLQNASAATVFDAAREASSAIARELGRLPDVLLLHATPGHEELILKGIASAIGAGVPVYGGSAADDAMVGDWRVFAQGREYAEGFILAGLASARPVLSAFIGGYVPTANSGVVTRAEGRTVFEIDSRPAADIYNEWAQGLIEAELATGGNVVFKTNILPLARVAGESQGVPKRLLAHPHEVVAGSRALRFLSELSTGEQVTAMTATTESLIVRVRRVVERARAASELEPRGGVLIYCSGCLHIVADQAPSIAREFERAAGSIPFAGAATFGEQGRFMEGGESRHGNLMCSVLLL